MKVVFIFMICLISVWCVLVMDEKLVFLDVVKK